MTTPRQILPGRRYFISRRCTQRQFLLRPDDQTNAVFHYCLGAAAKRYGVVLIAWLAMSNHYHAVVYDPHGVLPAFLAYFHKLIAKALNARWKRWENLWASEQTCAVWLVDDCDVLDKVVYTLANAVADHLVEHARDWPGASSLPYIDGRALTVKRPKVFFRAGGSMPNEVTLVARPPTTWSGGATSWAERVRAGVADQERLARDIRLAGNLRVAGRKAVRRASPLDRATSNEPRRNLRPTIACKNLARRIRELALLRVFRAAYARARERFVAGHRAIVFPAGTYLLKLLGARCEPFAAPS